MSTLRPPLIDRRARSAATSAWQTTPAALQAYLNIGAIIRNAHSDILDDNSPILDTLSRYETDMQPTLEDAVNNQVRMIEATAGGSKLIVMRARLARSLLHEMVQAPLLFGNSAFASSEETRRHIAEGINPTISKSLDKAIATYEPAEYIRTDAPLKFITDLASTALVNTHATANQFALPASPEAVVGKGIDINTFLLAGTQPGVRTSQVRLDEAVAIDLQPRSATLIGAPRFSLALETALGQQVSTLEFATMVADYVRDEDAAPRPELDAVAVDLTRAITHGSNYLARYL